MKARLQKIIAYAGICSRRKAEELITAGKVTVNGKVASIGESADSETDDIVVSGKRIVSEKKVYLIMNKPSGYICERRDKWGRKSVYDLINIPERVFSIGRLDIDSEGLLLFTNDGDFANEIMHPRYEIKKVYEVVLTAELKKADVEKIKEGVKLDDGIVNGVFISKVSPKNYLVRLHEGRKHIVKRIFSYLGFRVTMLKRVAIGKLWLKDLGLGKWRKMSEHEKKLVFS